jgi:hypothetical protein
MVWILPPVSYFSGTSEKVKSLHLFASVVQASRILVQYSLSSESAASAARVAHWAAVSGDLAFAGHHAVSWLLCSKLINAVPRALFRYYCVSSYARSGGPHVSSLRERRLLRRLPLRIARGLPTPPFSCGPLSCSQRICAPRGTGCDQRRSSDGKSSSDGEAEAALSDR